MFTERTVPDPPPDRGFGWVMSIGLHVALILGLTLVGMEVVRPSIATELMSIGFQNRPLLVDHLAVRRDIFGLAQPIAEDSSPKHGESGMAAEWFSAADGTWSLVDDRPRCAGERAPTFDQTFVSFATIRRRWHERDRFRFFGCRCEGTYCRTGTRCPQCFRPY